MTQSADLNPWSREPHCARGAAGIPAIGAWGRFVQHRNARLLGPFLAYVGAVLLVSYFFPDWVFSELPFDGYAYLSYMIDPVGQTHRFPDHPLSDLLPAFWPAHVFFAVLPARLGHWLYKILLVSLLLYLVSQTAARLFGRGYGLAAAVLVGTNAFFFPIQGNEYVEGMVVFYLTVVLYLVARAAADNRRRWAWLLGAGLVCLISSAFLSLAYCPGLGLLYLLLKRKYGRPWLQRSDAWIGAGAASCFAFFCLAHRLYAGTWFYLANSVLKAQSFLGVDRSAGPLLNWFGGATWLFPCLVVLSYLLANLGGVSPRTHGRPRRWLPRIEAPGAVVAATLSCVACLGYLQFVKTQGTVSDPHYFNHLIPLVSLALAGIMSREFGPEFGRRPSVMLLCVPTAVYMESTATLAAPALNLLWFCLLAFAVALFTRNAPRLVEAAVATSCWFGLVALGASLSPTWTVGGPCSPQAATVPDQNGAMVTVRSLREEAFMAVVDWMTLVKALDSAGKTWMWFDGGEPLGGLYNSLCFASHLWQARLINEYLPNVVVGDHDWHGPAHRRAAPGMEALVPTTMGSQKLPALAQTLAQNGMRFQLLGQRPFVSGRLRFDLYHILIVTL